MIAFSDLAQTCDTIPTLSLLTASVNAQCPDEAGTSVPPPPPPLDSIAGFGAYLDNHLDCSLAELEQAARAVDYACCADDACGEDGEQGFAPANCNPECGGKLLAMYDTCSQSIDTGEDHCISPIPVHVSLPPRPFS